MSDSIESNINNKYSRKKFSIIGDSISTFMGYNPKGYSLYYSGETCIISGVKNVEDTWWSRVINYFDGDLLINNSFSGSLVTKLPWLNELFPSACSDERTNGLHKEESTPDIILIFMGVNDWANGVLTKTSDLKRSNSIDLQVFEDAYASMLTKLKDNYPSSEICCLTLGETCMSSDPNYKFPYSYGGTHVEVYNEIIRNLMISFKCTLVDVYKRHIPYDTLDGFHPNLDGMETLASLVIEELAFYPG